MQEMFRWQLHPSSTSALASQCFPSTGANQYYGTEVHTINIDRLRFRSHSVRFNLNVLVVQIGGPEVPSWETREN